MGVTCRRHGQRGTDLARSLKVTRYFGKLEVDATMTLICNFNKLEALVLNGPRIRSIGSVLKFGNDSSVCEYSKKSSVCEYGNESSVCE